jgi:hypothetical protein
MMNEGGIRKADGLCGFLWGLVRGGLDPSHPTTREDPLRATAFTGRVFQVAGYSARLAGA